MVGSSSLCSLLDRACSLFLQVGLYFVGGWEVVKRCFDNFFVICLVELVECFEGRILTSVLETMASGSDLEGWVVWVA